MGSVGVLLPLGASRGEFFPSGQYHQERPVRARHGLPKEQGQRCDHQNG